jgi:hypothetical protein
MNAKHFRELRAWQTAYAFKLRIYDLIEQGSLATDEKVHGQLREGSASAPSQIAEGFGPRRRNGTQIASASNARNDGHGGSRRNGTKSSGTRNSGTENNRTLNHEPELRTRTLNSEPSTLNCR